MISGWGSEKEPLPKNRWRAREVKGGILRTAQASSIGAGDSIAARVRRIQRRDDWGTTFIDARCEPPRTTTFAGAVSHVLVFSAVRRTVVLGALHSAGVTDLGSGDPERFHPSLAR